MALIRCPNCRREYDVPLSVLEKKVTCKACGHSFRAAALRSGKRSPGRKSLLWPIIAGCGVVLIVVLAVFLPGSEEEDGAPGPAAPEKRPPAVAAPAPERTAPPAPARAERTEAEKFCVAFLAAVGDCDLERLGNMISFILYHNARSGPRGELWTDLDEVDKILKKKEYLNALTDDTAAGAGFVRDAAVAETREISSDGNRATVEVLLENVLNGRKQKRTMKLVRIGGGWHLADQKVGPEFGGDLDAVAVEKPKTLDEKYSRRISPEGRIEKVPFLDETSPETRRELTRLVENLLGEDRNLVRDARERLVAAGKPAIPPLLSALVPVDYSDRDQIGKANRIIYVLRLITGRSFGFSPGFQDTVIRGSMEEDLKHAVRLWFGWWARYKDIWEGRDIKKEMEGW